MPKRRCDVSPCDERPAPFPLMTIAIELRFMILGLLAQTYSILRVVRTCRSLYSECNGTSVSLEDKWKGTHSPILAPGVWTFGVEPLGKQLRVVCPPYENHCGECRMAHTKNVAWFISSIGGGGPRGRGAIPMPVAVDNDTTLGPSADTVGYNDYMRSNIPCSIALDDSRGVWQNNGAMPLAWFGHVLAVTVYIRAFDDPCAEEQMSWACELPDSIRELVLRRGQGNPACLRWWLCASLDIRDLRVFDCGVRVVNNGTASAAIDVLINFASTLRELVLLMTSVLCQTFREEQEIPMCSLTKLTLVLGEEDAEDACLRKDTLCFILRIIDNAPKLVSVTLTGFKYNDETLHILSTKVKCLVVN